MTTLTAARPARPAAVLPVLNAAALAGVLVVCLVVGAYAAVVGGAASRAGNGPGGLDGVPQLALLAATALLAPPAAFAWRRQPARALLLLAGPAVVAFGFFFFAHAVDPCSLGIWTSASTVGGAPLCEYAHGGWSTNVRFHLLEHAVATWLLLGGYLLALGRAGILSARPG